MSTIQTNASKIAIENGSRLISKLAKSPEVLTIPVVSAFQLHDSYKKADKHEKKKTLIRNIFILASSGLGIIGGIGLTEKFLNKNTVKPVFKKLRPEILKNASIPAAGLFSGLLAGGIINKLLPLKYTSDDSIVQERLAEELNPEKKNSIKNSVSKTLSVITVTLGSVLAGGAFANKVLKTELPKATPLIKNSLKIAGMLFIGGIGHIASRKIFKIDKQKQDNKIQKEELKRIFKDYDTLNNELSSVLGSTFSTLSGFSIGKETHADKKLKRSFYEIISNVVIPASIIIPCTIAVIKPKPSKLIRTLKIGISKQLKTFAKKLPDKKYLKKVKNLIAGNSYYKGDLVKQTMLFPLTVASLYLGHSIGDYFNKKIADKLIQTKFGNRITETRQNIVKSAMKGVSEQDAALKQKAISDLATVNKLEKALNKKAKKEA